MNLKMPSELGGAYSSGSQRARVISEAWFSQSFYCVACACDQLARQPNNCKALDFVCPQCRESYQLKVQKRQLGSTILDGAYGAALEAMRSNQWPNWILAHYRPTDWTVLELLLIPRFAFSESSVIPRKPLSTAARRAGWTGCKIDLTLIPRGLKIPVTKGNLTKPQAWVRDQFRLAKPLLELSWPQRGWALDVLNAIRASGWRKFSTSDAYSFEPSLQGLHPENRNVRAKIRQQLQVLRDLGFLVHVGKAFWRVAGSPMQP